MEINKDKFFAAIKETLFKKFSVDQVSGLNVLIDEAVSNKTSKKHFAYMLATTYHETNATMQPIKELGGSAYYTKLYDVKGKNPTRAIQNGNTAAGDGPKYCGRGYVQLTWKNNYKKASEKLGLGDELVKNPDRVMEPKIAADIMFAGMNEGWFTGKKLSDYISDTKTDYVGARRIINGTDKANLIANYAVLFEKALA